MTSLNSHVYCDTLYVESSLQNLLFIFYSCHDSQAQNIPSLQYLDTILVFFHFMLDRDRRDKREVSQNLVTTLDFKISWLI